MTIVKLGKCFVVYFKIHYFLSFIKEVILDFSLKYNWKDKRLRYSKNEELTIPAYTKENKLGEKMPTVWMPDFQYAYPAELKETRLEKSMKFLNANICVLIESNAKIIKVFIEFYFYR